MSRVIDLPRTQATKAVIFARVSSREQEDGYSIDAQKHRLKMYCERRGLEIVRIFEITESSTRGDRTKFMDMIKFCKAQKQPIAIVADKVDRVQRSFKEYPLLDALVQSGKLELHFNTEGYVIHRESVSQERLMWSFGVIMAQSYVDNLRDNVKRAIDQKIRAGEYVSRAPLGYLNIREDSRRADIIPDTFREPLIRKMFEEFATGLYTTGQMRKCLHEWGLRTREGKSVSKSYVYEMLTNPFYYGFMVVKGKHYPHKYRPLIDKVLFDQCQSVLNGWNKKRFAYGAKEFVFRGILTCATNGKTVSSLTKTRTYKNGDKGEWTYLQSWDKNGKQMYIREEKVLEQAANALRNLLVSADALEMVAKYLKETHYAERDFINRQTDELQRERRLVQNRTSGLTELLIDGGISRDEYDEQRFKYQSRLMEITNSLEANQAADDGFKDSLLMLLDLCNKAPNLFASSTTEQKRRILNFVFLNLRLEEGTLCYSYRMPFGEIAEAAKSGKWSALVDTLRTSHKLRSQIIEILRLYSPPIQDNI